MSRNGTELFEPWSREHTLMLIKEYQKYDFLYKLKHPDHVNFAKKHEALEKIQNVLQAFKPNVTISTIKKKIKILQQQWATEKKRYLNLTKNGSSEPYLPRLWCYQDLLFLLDADEQYDTDDSNKTLQMPTYSNRDSPDFAGGSTTNKSLKRSISKANLACDLRNTAKRSLQLMDALMKNSNLHKEESKEDLFCRLLCKELKELKSEEVYDNFVNDVFTALRKAKNEERRRSNTERKLRSESP